MADRVGQQLGNYRLVALLGQGGFAEVYLGQHLRFNQQAAIKVLHAHLSGQEVEHFQREAETIAKLAHPGIVRVFDYDVQEGVPFLVMDYAPGGSLRQRYPRGSLVPLPVIVSVVKQVAEALQYAHDQKFIHRDVKPENMLVGRREEVLLSDFGIATIAHSSVSLSAQPSVGTIGYMAPEQIEGHARPASDQYALGVVVYEWLCGERPFEGSVSEVIVQHLSIPPLPLHERMPAIPSEVEQVVLRALAKDPKARFASVATFATALEQASQRALAPTGRLSSEPPALPSGPPAELANLGDASPSLQAQDLATPPRQAVGETPAPDQLFAPAAAMTPASTVLPHPLEPTMPVQQRARRLPRTRAALLMGLVGVIIAGGILGSLSLLAHFGVLGTRSTPAAVNPIRGGTWIDVSNGDPDSLIPNTGSAGWIDQALYLPLFYGDAQGVIQPGAATEVPTVQNGGISADATTWTFHLRPKLVWSDGQPYDARDVDFTWKLWLNPKFGANSTFGLNLITSADVSADHLSITFHLTQAFAPFLSLWVDGALAPLPAHHFSGLAPEAILKSPENLNPQVVSGPFMMSESQPGDHYTLVRNSRYYRASQGLPYLDKVVFRIVDADTNLKNLEAGSITSSPFLVGESLSHYTLTPTPTSAGYEALYFNFHNTVLATHLEVRQAMAMAIDHRALINVAPRGLWTPLCTDHPSALHPGYDPNALCPVFDLAAAKKLLNDNGWVIGPDGVRSKQGQRLEFEYSTSINAISGSPRSDVQAIIQRNFKEIGIQLDIQDYPHRTFFGSFLPSGKASPPSGAVAGRYDIAEYENDYGYDPDDSIQFACDQFPPKGQNFGYYCNSTLDALFQQELAAPDQGVRQQIFRDIHQIYLTEFPFITLFSPLTIALVHKGTHNFQPSPIAAETVNIWEWWCDNGKC